MRHSRKTASTWSHMPFRSGVIALETMEPLKAFAMLVLALSPTTAFYPSGLGVSPAAAVYNVLGKAFSREVPLFMTSAVDQRKYLNEFSSGQKVQGKVKKILPFGAFVDIGATKDALLHNSQLSDNFASKLRRKLKEGDVVDCRVQDVHLGNDQIALTTRMLIEEFEVGQKIEGKVRRVKDFGAFVDIGATKDALIHKSQLIGDYVENATEEKLVQPGDVLKCRIVEVERWKQQIALNYQVARLGEPLVFEPSSGEGTAKAAVIWLHGYGDNTEGWAAQMTALRDFDSFASWKWVHLQAPLIKQPFDRDRRSPAWGRFFDEDAVRVGGVDYNDPDDAGWYKSCVEAIIEEVEAVEKEGVPLENIILGGFSQGAAIGLETVLTMDKPVGGCVAFSGWLTKRTRDALKRKTSPKTSILLCHGTEDDLVDFGCAKAALAAIRAAGVEIQFEQYSGLAHDCNTEEMGVLANFLHQQICPEAPAPVINWEEFESQGGNLHDARSESPGDNSCNDRTIYVCQKTLQTLMDKYNAGKRVLLSYIAPATSPSSLSNADVMVPVNRDFLENVDQMMEHPRAEKVAKVFVAAVGALLSASEKHLTLGQLKDMQTQGDELVIGVIKG